MPIDQQQCSDVFQKLSKFVAKAAKKPSAENVHKFRTNIRRVEVVLERLVPAPDRNTKKLIKILARLRKKAGKVRDLDVQAAALRGVKISQSTQKNQLLRTLCSEREKREKKFSQNLDKTAAQELRERLKRASRKIEIPEGMEPLSIALQEFGNLAQDRAPLSAAKLHQYRITGKQVRYLAEMAQKDAEADRVIEQLKSMQDVIGDWHDWLTLTDRAEKLFGGVKDSPLVAAMRNLTRAKFRQGVDAVAKTKSLLSGEKLALVKTGEADTKNVGPEKSSKKHPEHAATKSSAAVA
jgi:CHAD domain-containing protein